MKRVRVQMMDTFGVYIDEVKADQLFNRSKKGMALVQYLIAKRGEAVPNFKLLEQIWGDESGSNPENAMKTLISRMRAQFNNVLPGLGACIVSDRGAYHWETPDYMEIDVYELDSIFDRLDSLRAGDDPEVEIELYKQMIALYQGDFLQNAEMNSWAYSFAVQLHDRFRKAINNYIILLKRQEDYNEIVSVCRRALEIDRFDDQFNIEMMNALIHLNRPNEAMTQYKHVVFMHYRYLGMQPSDDLQKFYKQIVQMDQVLDSNIDNITEELHSSEKSRGAFVCDYMVFKEIYNLQIRNLERIGSTMFLAVVMLSGSDGEDLDVMLLDSMMQGLLQIMRDNLRKGDIISQFSPNVYAILLPTVNYVTGNMVIERMKRLFYKRYPSGKVSFNFKLNSLTERT